ncbi:abortive infection family protein [Janibacter anophelis]|uniref:abortive infection family protein n=1 Tax=Janibacter anophelis TaxID=319054 RepID=UPI0008350307|nr:abortive infection family protein [Janibacter anophelis]
MTFSREDLVSATTTDSPWEPSTEAINFRVLQRIIDGDPSGHSPVAVAVAVTDLVRDELEKFGTSGGEIADNAGSKVLIRALTASASAAGAGPFTLPFRDFDNFKSYWKRNGCYGSYQARQELINELFEPLQQRLDALASGAGSALAVTDDALNSLTDPTAIRDHLNRIANLIESDPRAAVGNAKDLLESAAKLVLRELGNEYPPKPKLPVLIDTTHRVLGAHAKEFKDSSAIRSLLGGLSTTVKGVAELRNEAGTGHGRESVPVWVAPRHARLAVGATTVWVQFVLETLGERKRANPGSSR